MLSSVGEKGDGGEACDATSDLVDEVATDLVCGEVGNEVADLVGGEVGDEVATSDLKGTGEGNSNRVRVCLRVCLRVSVGVLFALYL